MLDRLATPAYYEGEQAAEWPGGRADHNPYAPGTPKHRDWATGFQNEMISQRAPE